MLTRLPSRVWRVVGNGIRRRLGFNRYWNHIFKQDFERHGVSATFVCDEEFAVTMEIPVIETDIVIVVVAVKGQFKLIEAKSGSIFCVPFCLFQFAYQSVIHIFYLLSGMGIKKAREETRASCYGFSSL